MTAEVVIYSTGFCPYCVRARKLLEAKGVQFKEIRVDWDAKERQEMETRSGRRSVPQIFVGELHVGGFDDMWALERGGKLNQILGLE